MGVENRVTLCLSLLSMGMIILPMRADYTGIALAEMFDGAKESCVTGVVRNAEGFLRPIVWRRWTLFSFKGFRDEGFERDFTMQMKLRHPREFKEAMASSGNPGNPAIGKCWPYITDCIYATRTWAEIEAFAKKVGFKKVECAFPEKFYLDDKKTAERRFHFIAAPILLYKEVSDCATCTQSCDRAVSSCVTNATKVSVVIRSRRSSNICGHDWEVVP